MEQMSNDKADAIGISEGQLLPRIMQSILNTRGVHSLSGGLSLNFLNKDPYHKGLRINITEKGVHVDIYVIVNYGVKIPEVAWNIQEGVKSEIESLTNLCTSEINIHVQGVYFDEQTI
ncbi:MAG: Asp23/Gls24 family envelope stress response protein [Anaerovoracaceae bacterium]|jgi:uncharacterized alkaline shock family protein YloU